ncbi:MAG: ABC transporter permease [Candidatus Borkfalkiaceae bacterium]|nr:ABC transporter permease [Christensenellaceae bacterium]
MADKSIRAGREPLFHVTKRSDFPKWKTLLVYVAAIALGFLLCSIIFAAAFGLNPVMVYGGMFRGAFGTKRKVWIFIRDTMLLLGVGLALIPAFKMKFWNLGGNGQITVGALAAVACMFYLGGKLPDGVVSVMIILSSVLAGVIWAVIPAIFKAFFDTNESLFTLMLNYIAFAFVNLAISKWNPSGSQSLGEITRGNLPVIGQSYRYLLIDIVIAVVAVLMFVYLKFSKHGYEISVVGESRNTARYVGINVKKVTIRTMVLSGAICGLMGGLIAGAWHHSVSAEIANNLGFTAIMTSWLAGFDPVVLIATSAFVIFLNKGMSGVLSICNITSNAIPDVVIGIIYFCIIGCSFFIRYRVRFNRSKKAGGKTEKEGK